MDWVSYANAIIQKGKTVGRLMMNLSKLALPLSQSSFSDPLHKRDLPPLDPRRPHVSTGASTGSSGAATAVAAGQEADNDAAEADDGADEGVDDVADAADDGHDGVADGLEDGADLGESNVS